MKKRYPIAFAIITVLILSLIFYWSKKPSVPSIDLSFESYVAKDVSVLIRLDNLGTLWNGLKKTNFYSELKNYLNWFFNEMPSESLAFSGDISDLQNITGIKLNEENIASVFGKKVLLAMWLEDAGDKRYLFISDLLPDSNVARKLTATSTQRKAFEEYKNVKINYFYGEKYWCIISGKLFVSNNIDVLKDAADLFIAGGIDSIAMDKEFINEISKISSPDYVYMRPDNIDMEKYEFAWPDIKSFLVSLKFSNGMLWESYIFNKGKSGVKNTRFDITVPANALLYASGNFVEKYLSGNNIADNLFVGNQYGFMLLPYEDKFAGAVLCKVKNKKLFLNGFEKWAEKNLDSVKGGQFEYKLPFLGTKKCKYFFVGDYFFITSPPEYSEILQNIILEKNTPGQMADAFNKIKLPNRVCGLLYADPPSILRISLSKNYFGFMGPTAGYMTASKKYFKTVHYFPLNDMPEKEWKNSFSILRRLSGKKIKKEKEKITRQNLRHLRDVIDLYKTKFNEYPNDLNVLVPKYISEIPAELITESTTTVSEMDGAGGWFYKEGWIFLNVYDQDSKGRFYTQW